MAACIRKELIREVPRVGRRWRPDLAGRFDLDPETDARVTGRKTLARYTLGRIALLLPAYLW